MKRKLTYMIPKLITAKAPKIQMSCTNGSGYNGSGATIGGGTVKYAICSNGSVASGDSAPGGHSTCTDGQAVNAVSGCVSGTNPLNPANCFFGMNPGGCSAGNTVA